MSTKSKRLLYSALCVGFLFAAGLVLDPLQQMRQDYDLTSEPVKGVSPQLVLATQVLGWGRGLIIDVIWIRMESLKQQDRFFELVQLADWACKLAPRFPQVWDIQSWNLAYNVSCRVSHLPDRWEWVWSGIKLLRDQGIPQNPHSAMLYDRLAWTLFHKIGEQDDNAHFFYKQKFGLMMHEVLGGDGNEEALQALIGAPRSPEELLQDEHVSRLSAECSRHGFDIVGGYFEWYKDTPSVPGMVKEILKRPYNAEPLAKIALYERAKRLREECKLDPGKMLELTEQYGPFDWRSAYPHAIYWATIGLEKLTELEQRTVGTFDKFGLELPTPDPVKEKFRKDETLYEFRRVTLERIIYASMQSLARHGRLLFDTKGRFLLEAGTDYRFADATLPLFEKVIEAHGIRFKMGTRDAHKFFLRRGVMEFYLMGKHRKSLEYFRLLQEKFPTEVAGRPYDQYRREELIGSTQDMTTSEARRLVVAGIQQALFSLGCNADDKAESREQAAVLFAQKWNEEAEPNLRGTIRFDKLKEAVVTDILTGRVAFPQDVLANLSYRLEQKTGDKVVQRVLGNLAKAKERLPELEEVEEEWQKETY